MPKKTRKLAPKPNRRGRTPTPATAAMKSAPAPHEEQRLQLGRVVQLVDRHPEMEAEDIIDIATGAGMHVTARDIDLIRYTRSNPVVQYQLRVKKDARGSGSATLVGELVVVPCEPSAGSGR